MPCAGRRGCTERFRDYLSGRELMIILAHHGTCAACARDVTDHPRFGPEPDGPGYPQPYCPACFEERWPTGAAGPFERGQPQVYQLQERQQ